MKHFTIDAENNITIHASRKDAKEAAAELAFSTEEQFADLIGNDNKRLLDIWNSLPGVKPVTKFTDRKVATQRIWKAIQSLGGAVAPAPQPEAPVEIAAAEPVAQPEPAPESVAPPAASEPSIPAAEQQPEPAAASQVQEPSAAPVEAAQHTTPFDPVANASAGAAQVAPVETKASKKASRAKKAPTGETNASTPREGSKTSQVIAMLKREGGTTLEEIMSAMGWQKHTTRAMLSAGGSLTKKHGLVVTSQKVGDKRTYRINQ